MAGLLLLGAFAGCDRPDAEAARGRTLVVQYQCGSCHVIPEVPAADGRMGPSLERLGSRSYIAGRWPNTPDTLARWIESPQAMVPGTLMPDMGVPPEDARAMARWLSRAE